MELREALAKLTEIENSLMESKINEAPEDDNQEEDFSDSKVKLVVPFEQLLDLFFKEDDKRIGRVAIRKIMRGDSDSLTIRERGVVAQGLIEVFPAIAGDRTIYNRIVRKKSEQV